MILRTFEKHQFFFLNLTNKQIFQTDFLSFFFHMATPFKYDNHVKSHAKSLQVIIKVWCWYKGLAYTEMIVKDLHVCIRHKLENKQNLRIFKE